MAERIWPIVAVRRYSPNRYSPRGSPIRLIILHSTESHNRVGKSDLEGIAEYFAQPGTEASSHVLTDADGKSARCVRDSDAAWTQVSYNRVSLSVEQIGFASQTRWPEAEVKETARWIAKWSRRHGIPIRRAWTVGGRVVRSGVTTHRRLGSAGGGHTDPGTHFPFRHCLELARHYRKLQG